MFSPIATTRPGYKFVDCNNQIKHSPAQGAGVAANLGRGRCAKDERGGNEIRRGRVQLQRRRGDIGFRFRCERAGAIIKTFGSDAPKCFADE